MLKKELYQFGNYEIYGIDKCNNKIILCVCENYNVSRNIAIRLASLDKDHDHYYVGIIVESPEDIVVGGGNYDEYWYDENEKLHHKQIS